MQRSERFQPSRCPWFRRVGGLCGRRCWAMVLGLILVQGFPQASGRNLAARPASSQSTLSPARGQILDRHGRLLATNLAGAPSAPPRGTDLYVTLDARLQEIAEHELATQVQETQATGGLVLLMHPPSGDLVAMASYPSVNLYDVHTRTPPGLPRYPAMTALVEPGATFTLVTAAAVLEAHVARVTDRFDTGHGVVVRHGQQVRDPQPYGILSFAQILEKSSNIGIVKLAARLRDAQFYTAIRRLGFGEPSGVNLPGEEAGQVRPPRQWSTRTHDALALGHEVTVTPLQLLAAYAAVANGGWLMRPRLVEWVIQGDNTQFFPPQVRRRVLAPQTVEHLNAMLVGVVERGTGQQAAIEGYTTAGQTGTAQRVVREGAGHRQRLVTFVGYVPAEAPQLALLVMLDEPRRAAAGSAAAAALFQRIVQQALYYLQVGPSRTRQP